MRSEYGQPQPGPALIEGGQPQVVLPARRAVARVLSGSAASLNGAS